MYHVAPLDLCISNGRTMYWWPMSYLWQFITLFSAYSSCPQSFGHHSLLVTTPGWSLFPCIHLFSLGIILHVSNNISNLACEHSVIFSGSSSDPLIVKCFVFHHHIQEKVLTNALNFHQIKSNHNLLAKSRGTPL
jgi:hypothetical protein